MIQLFSNVEELRGVVKVNASLPWDSVEPYITDATDIYLRRYLGVELAESLTTDDELLMRLLRRAIGPLAMCLAADEMSVSIGDGGITVQNESGKRSPASDAKIAAAKKNMLSRGYAALSRVIAYLLSKGSVPEGSPLMRQSLCLVNSLESFEQVVSIDGCYVSYYELLPLMMHVQSKLCAQFPPVAALVGATELSSEQKSLRHMAVCHIVFHVSYLHTSNTTRQQRASEGRVEWRPVLRPLFVDTTDHGNYYKQEADSYLTDIERYINNHAEAFGVERVAPLEFNSQKRKIFYTYG